MKPKKPSPVGANTLNAIEWLNSILPDTLEMRAIEDEENAKYNLAVALTQAREAAGHTQTSLATQLGVQQSLVSKWEKIDHNHTLETLLHLCNATGAKLVMGLEVNGQLLPITSATERCILLSEKTYHQVEQQAHATNLTLHEVLAAPLIAHVINAPRIEALYEAKPRASNVTVMKTIPGLPHKDLEYVGGLRYAS
jgi:transcriptional regulator with XRE-family HTH domain